MDAELEQEPEARVNIARAGDDRPGYVIGIARDAAAWLATDMLPTPQVVEQAILDMEDQDAREAGEAAMACADYFSAIAQMYQHDVRDPVDAPLVVEITIPGVPGIGPKTAAALLARHETLDALYAHLSELPARQADALRAHRNPSTTS